MEVMMEWAHTSVCSSACLLFGSWFFGSPACRAHVALPSAHLLLSPTPPSLLPSFPSPPVRVILTSLLLSPGVKAYEVDLKGQSATVIANPDLDYDTVLKKIAKTGKKVNSGEADGEEKSVEVVE